MQERAERHRRRGRGGDGHSTPALGGARAARRRCVVLSGDVPLVSAEAIARAARGARASGAAATMATSVLEDPSGYGRVVRDASGAVERVVETKASGDATQSRARDRRGQHGHLRVRRRARCAQALPRLSADNAQGELYLPQVLDLLRGDGARDRRARASRTRARARASTTAPRSRGCAALAQAAIHERHMLAGVSDRRPRRHRDRRRRARSAQDTVIEPFTTIRGRTRIGSGCTIRHSYLARLRARGRRQRRPVRLPAPRHGAARGREGRDVRGGQELGHRRGRENPPPLLHRRRRRRRAAPTSARPRSPPTTTGAPSTARRSASGSARGVDTTLVAPVTRRRRRVHGRRLGDHRGRARRRAGHRPRAPEQRRGLHRARGARAERRAARAFTLRARDEQRDGHAHPVLAGEPADRLQQAADAVQRAREPAAGASTSPTSSASSSGR